TTRGSRPVKPRAPFVCRARLLRRPDVTGEIRSSLQLSLGEQYSSPYAAPPRASAGRGPPDLSSSSVDRADHTALPIAGMITGMRWPRPRHVNVDARTKSVESSDGAVRSGGEARCQQGQGRA